MQSPPPPSHSVQSEPSEMDTFSNTVIDEPTASLWDWSDFLDFNLDDQLALSWDSDQPPPSEPHPVDEIPALSAEIPGRVRKRDPRMTCSNFLAGRIPCACPELDAKLEEEEGGQGKKRARTVRAATGTARCQVPGCEADISELKGYHRRHRVCLRCANATAVVLDGQSKRYCQQCGKFHILSDFDEGKRSCRRKLERHNNRRRRKPAESRDAVERESQGALLSEDVACDDEARKDSTCLSSQTDEKEALLEHEDRRNSTLCSAHDSQNIQSDSVLSFVSSDETLMDGEKDNSKTLFSPYCDNKSAYSSTCPTGRISFKLYDWNPAEFPRRLRNQIFQWLASMPVELEGYIRPGCTILTVFVAMPKSMWLKLFEDPAIYIHDFVIAPGKMLSGRGTLLVYLNDMIFRVRKEETSVMKVEVAGNPPKLHYVHPTCFEAGKPMEFVACGSNLLQPKFRFLVSFAGKYLTCDYCIPLSYSKTGGNNGCSLDHQLYKIYIPTTEPDLFGPAFIEVENQSGLSNFIPILIGYKEICSEIKTLQQKFDASFCSKGSQFAAIGSLSNSCEVFLLRQRAFSEFLLDIAWLLKEPTSENIQHISSSQIERFDCLLNFLIHNNSTTILERVLQYMTIWLDNMKLNTSANGTADTDMSPLQRNIDRARDIIGQKFQKEGDSVVYSGRFLLKEDCFKQSSEKGMLSIVPITNQEMEMGLMSADTSEKASLLNGEVVMNVNLFKEQPRKTCSRIFSNTNLNSRPFIFVIAAAAVCFGICAVLLHPKKVVEFTVTIRRGLFDNS
ncbi:squamosa promoter-binding-like protein 7 [Cornus florida]|uniref:squamosa promoter-binding-like protein 7 n=1 Tax=Cornus florida TaxID=4283 RepID=UPI00289F2497|nr:squamosa promoter-binding-like protein 7 [Cornus florida]